jgi:hypothetical protein
MTVWDTETDAKEFFDAYAKRTSRRYAGSRVTETTSMKGQERQVWQTSEGDVVLQLRGLRVLILEGVPGHVDAKNLLRLLWQ